MNTIMEDLLCVVDEHLEWKQLGEMQEWPYWVRSEVFLAYCHVSRGGQKQQVFSELDKSWIHKRWAFPSRCPPAINSLGISLDESYQQTPTLHLKEQQLSERRWTPGLSDEVSVLLCMLDSFVEQVFLAIKKRKEGFLSALVLHEMFA